MAFSQKYGSKGSQKSFAQVPNVTTPRSSFNRSHGHKTTFDSGHLIPILLGFISRCEFTIDMFESKKGRHNAPR